MPRSLSAAVLSAIAGKTVSLALFAKLVFADNTYYLFTGVGTITPAGPASNPASTFPYGQTFNGLGWLGKVSSIPQTTKLQAQNVTLALSGIPSALVSEAIDQVRMSGTATLWYGFYDANGTLLTDPVQIFSGAADVPSLSDNGQTCELAITYENTLLSLNLAPNHRFDDTDQQLRFPGDLGFGFVQSLQNIQLFWPSSAATGSPYPVFMTVTPGSVDIAVGGSTTVQVTIHYSNGTTKTKPAGTGSGPNFDLGMASSNPKVATFQYTATNNVTGVAPGECSIMTRILGSGNATWKSVCSIFVHS
jgi:hypothetical protein